MRQVLFGELGVRVPKPEKPIVDIEYRDWIRKQPCALKQHKSHACWGRVTFCHVKTVGSGGSDHGNMYPGCVSTHTQQGAKGFPWILKRYGVDLKAEAERLWEVYQQEKAA